MTRGWDPPTDRARRGAGAPGPRRPSCRPTTAVTALAAVVLVLAGLLATTTVLVGPGAAPAAGQVPADPPAEEGTTDAVAADPVDPPPAAPSLAWADPGPEGRDDLPPGTDVPALPAPPPAPEPPDGGAATDDTGAAVAPRLLTLGSPSSSRAISAPTSDPMSMMQRDGVLSVKLSDGRQLWMFADSALVVGNAWDYFSGHGTGAISVSASDPYTITEPTVPTPTYPHPASQLIVGDQFSCPVGYGRFAWPSSAVAIPTGTGGDTVYIYYQSMCGKDGDQGSYFNVAMGIARYDYNPAWAPSVALPIMATAVNSNLFPPMPGHNGPGGAGYGTTSVYANGYVYAYGCHYSPVWQNCRVARVAPASIATSSAYRFWNGSTWVADMGAAADMDLSGSIIGVKGSVSYVPSLGLYAFADNDFPNPTVVVRWASQPQGPWTVPTSVTLPGCTGTDCWAGEVQGSLSSPGNLVISYYADGLRPGSRAISVPIVHEPVGGIDMVASGAPNRMVFWGWAVDPDVVDPITLRLQLDGTQVDQLLADQPRSDLAARYPGQIGGGFVRGVDVTPGHHTLCVVGVNRGLGASARTVACREFDVVAPRYGPVTAVNDDGRLETFAMDATGLLVHAWQVTPGGPWSDWEGTGLDARSAPAVARNGDGRLELFAVDGNGWLVHRWQVVGQGWSSWWGLGAQASGTPAVGVNKDGRLELFAMSSSGRLLHAWQSPPSGWSPIVDSGASARFAPAVAASADGRLEVFVTSGDGGLLHAWQTRVNGPFSAWQYTGVVASTPPSVVRSADGRLELFAGNDQGSLAHQWQVVPSGAWSSWQPFGFMANGRAVPVRNQDGRLEVFALDGLGRLWHSWQDPRSGSGWWGWETVHQDEIPLWTQPAAALQPDGRLAVVAVASWGQLLQTEQEPGVGWLGWRTITPGQP